ncbi:MAG: T9SS type A sorting domain-containing protein [Bergeyella sp.]
MKNFYLLLVMFFSMNIYAQTYTAKVSQEDPLQPWIVTFTHNDWAFFDAGYEVPVKVYLWVEPEYNSAGINHYDQWGLFQINLAWNESVGALQGSVNLKDYVFNGSNTSLANGVTLNNFEFILVGVPTTGAWPQTADLLASNYGFTPFTLETLAVSETAKSQFKVAGGKLFTSEKGTLELGIYDFSGKLIKSQTVNSNGNPVDLNLDAKGLYILTIKSEKATSVVKFSN